MSEQSCSKRAAGLEGQSDLLGQIFRTSEVSIRKSEDKELVRIGIGAVEILQEVVVIRYPESMHHAAGLPDVGTEGHTLDLRGNLICGEPRRGKCLDDIEKERLVNRIAGCSRAVH